ncbi:3329_t:CDS:2, partial [Racocetra fulgida]
AKMSKKFELESNKNIGSWKKLYEDVLAHFNIRFDPEPSPLQTELQTDVQIFESDLVIDLNELFKYPKNEINAQVIRIYGDVVQLSDNLEIQMLGSHGIILIVARLFEIKHGCQISIKYKEENNFQLLIYTMEMPSELIIKNEDKNPLTFKINSPNIGGLISLHSDEFKDIPDFASIILQKKPFSKILRFSLQIAIALFYDNRKVTRSILTWIIKINEQLKDNEEKEFEMTKKLYYRALRMLDHLNAFIEREKSEFTFVPRLNMENYKNHICQLLKFAKDYENEYKNVLKHEYNNKQKIKKLNYKLLDHNDITKMHEILKEKEKNALEEFKEGIDNWLKERKHAAQKELFLAILDLSVSVGKVVIQPGGVLNFVDTVKKVSKSVQDVIEHINIENIKALFKITNDDEVKKELEQANDINNKADKIKEITNKLKSNHDMAGELNKSAVEMSADEYLKSLIDFINLIDAHIEAKIEESERSKELSGIDLQVETCKKIEERLEQRIQLENDSQDDEIILLLFEHLIDIKYCMTLFMEKYRSAYKYWTLSESKLELSVIKEFNESVINKMFEDLDNAFNDRPRIKENTFEFKETYIDKFKQNSSVIIDIPLDCDELKNYARLRLHAFRIYLNGVGSINESIGLYISHSDTFADRDKNNNKYYFKSDPKREGFEYKVNKDHSAECDISEKYKIVFDNIYYKLEDKNYSFAPTPFSQWTISLYKDSKCDLSSLESIIIYLE